MGALLSAGWAVASSVPALRARPATGAHEDLARWVLLRIPLGTVVTEELLFRSVFYALTRRAWTPPVARAVCAVAFGLWHVRTARLAGDSVPLVLAATTAAGVGFDWLRARSGSVVAPALVHYALNAGGALMIARTSRGVGYPDGDV
ncbi:CPBP family intramembrane glutamic endopeptidase [Speluncibacter jeojiensis]|uniref:CPBP family intramembrane metalloprotease n=1 Tax=Speluncibacter jeojiensis TaxID=2710754 RepID=A0A9X4M139_9ACTN|nr:CPBP family intramembrane metalloprotease [Corynebacteriales bacterium D3-21]